MLTVQNNRSCIQNAFNELYCVVQTCRVTNALRNDKSMIIIVHVVHAIEAKN